MAAGRHCGYKGNEFRDWEVFAMSKEENDHTKYKGGLDWRAMVWLKDIEEGEVINRSDSGSCDAAVGAIGGPGELSTDGSDGVVFLEDQSNKKSEVIEMENMNHLSSLPNKKRKFSPVWDIVERERSPSIKSRSSAETASAAASPLAETTYLHPEEQWAEIGGNGAVDVDDDDHYAPRPTIICSRWAIGVDSPTDEGELFNDVDVMKLKNEHSFDLDGLRYYSKSDSPEYGKVKRECSEGSRARSSGVDECGESSFRANYRDTNGNNDFMEIDSYRNCDGASGILSETESEDDDLGSHGAPMPFRSVNMLNGCRSVDEFEKLNKINEGTYGVVYRARDMKTGEIVALKKVKMEKEREGFPLTALREINILLSFNHPSIVNVKEIVTGNLNSIFMVMEYMDHDLKALMETLKHPFSESEVKRLMLQLLGGVKHLHDNWVLHRDMKTSNLLLNKYGELKICDFGLARQYGSPLKPYTHMVVTLWYRAPELLLGAKQYSTAIDMWSVGCIMAELLSKQPLFNGKTEFDQLDKIFKILGTPNEKVWPGFSELPGVKVNFVKHHQYNILRRKFPATSFTGSPVLSDAGFDLLSRLLTYDPEKRISAEAAINHEWFHEVPFTKSRESCLQFLQSMHRRGA